MDPEKLAEPDIPTETYTRFLKAFPDDRNLLVTVVNNAEPNPEIRKTLIGVYDALVAIKLRVFNSRGKERDGMLLYTNYDSRWHMTHDFPPLYMESWEAELFKMDNNYSVHNPEGRHYLENLLYPNGAIEIDAESGMIVDCQKKIMVYGSNPKERLREKKIKSSDLGFNEQARKTIASRNYTGVGTRHMTAITATIVDPDLWTITLGRESGAINFFRRGRIAYSAIPDETNKYFLDPDNFKLGRDSIMRALQMDLFKDYSNHPK